MLIHSFVEIFYMSWQIQYTLQLDTLIINTTLHYCYFIQERKQYTRNTFERNVQISRSKVESDATRMKHTADSNWEWEDISSPRKNEALHQISIKMLRGNLVCVGSVQQPHAIGWAAFCETQADDWLLSARGLQLVVFEEEPITYQEWWWMALLLNDLRKLSVIPLMISSQPIMVITTVCSLNTINYW